MQLRTTAIGALALAALCCANWTRLRFDAGHSGLEFAEVKAITAAWVQPPAERVPVLALAHAIADATSGCGHSLQVQCPDCPSKGDLLFVAFQGQDRPCPDCKYGPVPSLWTADILVNQNRIATWRPPLAGCSSDECREQLFVHDLAGLLCGQTVRHHS